MFQKAFAMILLALVATVIVGHGCVGNWMIPSAMYPTLSMVAAKSTKPTGEMRSITIKTDPTGDLLYVVDVASGKVTTFAIDQVNGDLTMIESPTVGGSAPRAIAIDAKSKFLLLAGVVRDPSLG